MKKTIMKVSPDKNIIGFDDVDPEVIALKKAILAGAAKKSDAASCKLQSRWFYITDSGKIVGPMKVKGMGYASRGPDQGNEWWTASGQHKSDDSLNISRPGFDNREQARQAACALRKASQRL